MNLTRMLLGLAAAVSFALLTVAAPAPAPESQGPISDALRLRGKMASTAPPTSTRVVMSDDNTVVVDRVTMQYVAEQRTVTVEKDGKAVQQTVVGVVRGSIPCYPATGGSEKVQVLHRDKGRQTRSARGQEGDGAAQKTARRADRRQRRSRSAPSGNGQGGNTVLDPAAPPPQPIGPPGVPCGN